MNVYNIRGIHIGQISSLAEQHENAKKPTPMGKLKDLISVNGVDDFQNQMYGEKEYYDARYVEKDNGHFVLQALVSYVDNQLVWINLKTSDSQTHDLGSKIIDRLEHFLHQLKSCPKDKQILPWLAQVFKVY